jgi:hypothetical protein
VTFRLNASDLAYYDEDSRRLAVAGGRYTLYVGSSSRDLGERASFDLVGLASAR